MKDNFSVQSNAYARYRPAYPVMLIDYICSQVSQKDHAWDCGTGNGQVALVLADTFKKVSATDISEAQLKNAVKKPNISYKKENAEQTNFEKSSFDLITIAQAIHWFDFEKFYNEVNRTLKPGGIIAAFGYGLNYIDDDTDKVIRYLYTDILGDYWDKERKYIDETYKTIPFPFEEIHTPAFSMQYQWSMEELLGYLSSWSAVQRYIKKNNGKDPLDYIRYDLRKIWNYEPHKNVRFPLFMRLGRKK
jgi:ubiquinone/menaquinone biosynthesis C-methylase UbiE